MLVVDGRDVLRVVGQADLERVRRSAADSNLGSASAVSWPQSEPGGVDGKGMDGQGELNPRFVSRRSLTKM